MRKLPILFFALLALVTASRSGADTLPAPSDPAASNSAKIEQLSTIQRDITWVEQEVEQKKKDLAGADKDEISGIRDELNDLESRLEKDRLSFIAIASDVELSMPEKDTQPKKRDLVQELEQVIEPLFDAVHRVSEKPRRIEALRTHLFNLNDQLAQIERAQSNLEHVIQGRIYPQFAKQLVDSRDSLSHTRDELEVRRDSIQRRLDQELGDHRTVMQVISETVRDFLASRGKNLLISGLVFLFVFWGLLFVRKFVFRSSLVYTRFEGFHRPLKLLYIVASGLLAILSVLITLHFLNDYFLVTVIILLLAALGWSSKAVITHFFSEAKLALNLGAVKQGERVVWQGVPWLVKSLGFRTILVNEALQGGRIMLPVSVMGTLLSRQPVEGEPWFPTRIGDYVLLDDGNYGQIETQTPETVVLATGNARKFYSTSAFLAKNPQNFSHGFEVSAELVVRQSAPPRNLPELRPQLEKAISTRLASRLGDPDFRNFHVTIAPSGPRATRIALRADCGGNFAANRDALRRELHTAASEAWCEVVPN